MEKEQVLVVKKEIVEKYRIKDFSPDFQIEEDLADAELEFKPRDEMEVNPDYKQIIPYCVILSPKGFFVYQRTKKGGESRLHDKWSLGIGGHINPVDQNDEDKTNIYKGLLRELEEEVGLDEEDFSFLSYLGAIYNENTPVNAVHLGLVYLVFVDDPDLVKVSENSLANGKFVKFKELMEMSDKLEDWSKITVEALLENFHNLI